MSRARQRVLALALAAVGLAVVGEVAARILVAREMDPEDLRIRTHDTDVKGRYRSHPSLPYVPLPGYPSHDSRGFRNPELADPKPEGVLRVACLGASTTYGHQRAAEEAWPARLGELLREDGRRVEVVNAGVPGWTSRETLISLRERVLQVAPDVVIVYQGRNELFPQAFNRFQPDYSHFRDPDYDFTSTNRAHKALFRVSYLALLVCTHDGQRFGWESRLENPIYACNLKPNVPSAEEVVRNLGAPERDGSYRENVRALVESAREAGARVVLCTMAFRAERFATGMIPEDPSIHPALAEQVRDNNEIVREVAAALDVALVETAAMASDASWFRDDCHMTVAGHLRRAELVRDGLAAAGILAR